MKPIRLVSRLCFAVFAFVVFSIMNNVNAEDRKQRTAVTSGEPRISQSQSSLSKTVKSKSPETWTEPTTGMEFVHVPDGCFEMGSPATEPGRDPDEDPLHEVCVDAFWMGTTEVTNAQYRLFKPDHKSGRHEKRSLGRSGRPVVRVTWDDAQAYAEWLSEKSVYSFRLPTEAEWEYACRAGTSKARYWGDEPNDVCRYANVYDQTSKEIFNQGWPHFECDDGYHVSSPVGIFQPNAFGLYDMLGNVWEWCEDWYEKTAYSRHDRTNPLYTRGAVGRVMRGSSWFNRPKYLRCANRGGGAIIHKDDIIGFRLVRDP